MASAYLNPLYTLFFLIHIPVMFLVDLYTLYPPHLIPAFMTDLHTFYAVEFKDHFFIADLTPPWFNFYIWMEGLLHAPVGVWWLSSNRKDNPILHLVMLLLALQITITTGTCIAEFRSWEDLNEEEMSRLGWLYTPYLCFAIVLGVDMFVRLWGVLSREGGKIRETERKERKRIE